MKRWQTHKWQWMNPLTDKMRKHWRRMFSAESSVCVYCGGSGNVFTCETDYANRFDDWDELMYREEWGDYECPQCGGTGEVYE